MEEMVDVGFSSAIVAFIGVVAPFGLGYIVTMLLLPGLHTNIYLFVGATLCATSIGITARVFRDMGKLHIPEAKIVLGAAVIDDVLGLIILAVIAGIISTGTVSFFVIGTITLKAVVFLGVTLFIGKKYLRRQIKIAALVEHRNIRLLFPFALLVFLAWLSDLIGLASIVGAFAAGLIIKEEYFVDVDGEKTDTVKRVMLPIETLFAPIFFVIMGLQVDLSTFLDINILGIALLLTLVAIIGKIISGIFIKSMDRNIIGIGMIPRGEVGLIFASIGKALGVLDSSLFSVIIIIVILTTFITLPALKWAFDSYDRRRAKISSATS
jgi:Kef-type K+ transport system membrane component KefB